MFFAGQHRTPLRVRACPAGPHAGRAVTARRELICHFCLLFHGQNPYSGYAAASRRGQYYLNVVSGKDNDIIVPEDNILLASCPEAFFCPQNTSSQPACTGMAQLVYLTCSRAHQCPGRHFHSKVLRYFPVAGFTYYL